MVKAMLKWLLLRPGGGLQELLLQLCQKLSRHCPDLTTSRPLFDINERCGGAALSR
jgi:hypothetical protein